jgi:predicted amidohydrolase
MGKLLRIALVQPEAAPAGAADPHGFAMDAARRLWPAEHSGDPDVVLFPEIYNIGFADDGMADQERLALLHDLAVTGPDHPFLAFFRDMARARGTAVAVGVLMRTAAGLSDSMVVIDRTGDLRLVYDKVHLSAFDFEAYFVAGNSFPTAEIDTRLGPLRVGCMICYDREFPETARCLMLEGAELILTANCCVLDQKRLAQFQARAFENATAMVMANYANPLNGRSISVSPQGDILALADESPGVLTSELSLEDLRAYRQTCGWGDAYRKPGLYSSIVDTGKLVCFQRTDYRGRQLALGMAIE